MIRGWSAVVGAIPHAPRTCSEWAASQDASASALRGLGFAVPRLPVKKHEYLCIWTVRLYMLILMHMKGIAKLQVDPASSIQSFLRMNPDQRGRLIKIYHSHKNECHSVQDLLALCGWEHSRPELLSMMACFAGDKGLRDSDFDESKFSQWCAHRDRLEGELKFPPHCAIVAQATRHA